MAEAVSYKQINLSWRDNSDDEDHFRIACDMGLGNGHNQFLVRLPANTTHYEHCKLQPMTEYRYFVIAGRGGESAASERFSARTPCPVIIFNLWCKYYSNPAWVEVILYNQAVEIAQVELTIGIYDGANLLTIIVEEVAIEGLGTLWFQNFYELDQGVYATRCTADITDVEIEY